MKARGFTLLELLVATAILMLVTGAIAAFSLPMRHAFERGMAGSETTIRARAALETIVEALRQSGAGAVVGAPAVNLALAGAIVIPRSSLDDAGSAAPFTAVTVIGVRAGAAQATLSANADAGSGFVRLDSSAPCPRQMGGCGFVDGTAAVIYDASRLERVTVAGVNAAASTLALTSSLANTFNAGAVVAEVESDTYGVRPDADGSGRLVRITSAGAEQTLIDHVVWFEIALDDRDWRRARRADIWLRVEAAAADLRGPAGPLFRRAGTAREAARWLPDIELSSSVALRNR